MLGGWKGVNKSIKTKPHLSDTILTTDEGTALNLSHSGIFLAPPRNGYNATINDRNLSRSAFKK